MQPQEQAPYGQPPTAPAKKKTNWAMIGGIGCLSLVVVCCVVPTGGFFAGTASAKSDAEETVNEIAEIGRARDATRMHAMLDSYARTSVDAAQMPEMMARCTGLTTHTAVTVGDIEIDHPFDDFVIVEVTWQTPTGAIPGSIGLERGDDGFLLGTYHEDVPGQAYGTCDPTRAPYVPTEYGY